MSAETLRRAASSPAVSCIIADWLNAMADEIDHVLPLLDGTRWEADHYPVDDPPPPGYGHPEVVEETVEARYRWPLAVARAYLGETP